MTRKRVFGLREAKILDELWTHLPTVKATLNVLGVVNNVGAEVAKMVTEAQAVVLKATEEIKRLQEKDAVDAEATSLLVAETQEGRASRATENGAEAAGLDQRNTALRAEIASLQELAKKFF